MAFTGTLEKDDPGRKIEPGEFESVAVPYLYRTIDWNHSSRVSGPFVWTAPDLEAKLGEFRHYYNEHHYNKHRTHAGLNGRLPNSSRPEPINLTSCSWQKHGRGLYQTPAAA